jgi:lactoylglutathione lyase
MKYEMIHTCIRVMDLKKSELFYQQAFGFEVARRLEFPDHKCTLSWLRSPGGTFELELTWNHDQKEPYIPGTGYSHLAVGVKDLIASHKQHEAMGLHPQPLKSLSGSEPRFYFLADPDGYLIEVVRT